MRTMQPRKPDARVEAGAALGGKAIGIGVDDGQCLTLEGDRHRDRDDRRAAERRAAVVVEIVARQLLVCARAGGAGNQRIHAQRQHQLRHIGRVVESDLILALETVGLEAEERDARELSGEVPHQRREEIGNRRLFGQLLDRL